MRNQDQQQFDSTYVTSTEIARDLSVSRAALCQAVSRGLLPNPITINNGQVTLFNRENVKPYVNAWRIVLTARRVAKNG